MSREANIANLRWLITVSAGDALKTMAGLEAATKQVGKNMVNDFKNLDDPLRHLEVLLNKITNAMNRGNFTPKIGKDLDDLISRLDDPRLSNVKLFDSFGNNRLKSLNVISQTLREKYVAKNPTQVISGLNESAADLALRTQLETSAKFAAQAKYNQDRSRYNTQQAQQFYDPTVQAAAMQQAREDRDNATRGEEIRRRAINHAKRYWQEEQDAINGTTNSSRFQAGIGTRSRADAQAARDARYTATTPQDYADRAQYLNRQQPPQTPAWATAEANTQRILAGMRSNDDNPFVRKLASMSREEVEKVRQRFIQLSDAGGNYTKQLEGLAVDARNRAQDDRMGRGSNTRQFRWQMMNLGYGIEDASVGYQLNGIKGAIRGSLNNVTAMAQGIRNPYMAGGAVIAATAAGMTLPPLIDYLNRVGKGSDKTDQERTDAFELNLSQRITSNEIGRGSAQRIKNGRYDESVKEAKKRRDELDSIDLASKTARDDLLMANKKLHPLAVKRERENEASRNQANIFGFATPLAYFENIDAVQDTRRTIGGYFNRDKARQNFEYDQARLQADAAEKKSKEIGMRAGPEFELYKKAAAARDALQGVRFDEERFNANNSRGKVPLSEAEERRRLNTHLMDRGNRFLNDPNNKLSLAEKRKLNEEHRRQRMEEFESGTVDREEARRNYEENQLQSGAALRQSLKESLDPTASAQEKHYQQGVAIARMGLGGAEENKLHQQNDYARQIALDRINNLDYKPINTGITSGSVADAGLMQQFGANLNSGGGDQVGVTLVQVQQESRSLLQLIADELGRRNKNARQLRR